MLSVYSVIAALTFFLMPTPTVLYNANLEPIVTLPASYFVVQTDGEAPSGYIAVMYDDLIGFVKESAVEKVDFRPVTKFEKTVRFTVNNDGQPVNMRSSPGKSGAVISVLPDGKSGRCYGYIDGQQLIAGAGEKWYYVEIDGIRGYCYSAHVTVDATPVNIIEKEEDDPPTLPTDALPEEPEGDLPPTSVIILIVALCVPVPFIMIYMFRSPKNKDKRDR
ncbi:MAG: SH3 domain-containing protein [Clostridiales bacterium]|nr:SH3 domain-containing protein [Clostridiales bacterium]